MLKSFCSGCYGSTTTPHVREIICMEQRLGKYAFQGEEDSYCAKLLGGTGFTSGSGQRFYTFEH